VTDIENRIRDLAARQAGALGKGIDARMAELAGDDESHLLVYRVLGIPDEEGRRIDMYQNRGRLLYKRAGAFLESAARLCFAERFPGSAKAFVENRKGERPRRFEIDCLVGNDALEIKWRDATTDGDHILKEDARLRAIAEAGYVPIRVMFYRPNRAKAVRVQEIVEDRYAKLGGQYHSGGAAWKYVKDRTGVDLKKILETIAGEERR
jgi:hypothetical protein